MMYDYLVIGSGLFGSIFAYEMARRGNKVKVIEKRNHIAGNIYTEKIEDIVVHQYGAHIFHTQSKEIWDYVNQFAEFNRYTNSPIANYNGEIFNLPFNMNTFNKLWGVITPEEAINKINEQKSILGNRKPSNLEEQAISLVGTDIYKKLIKDYTEKQWGRPCRELPAFIINRLPVRMTFDNNYFNDLYQGIPIGGYTKIVEKLLDSPNIEVHLNTDFFDDRDNMEKCCSKKIIYTGMIDRFFEYKYGPLEYRSLKFVNEIRNENNYQGNAVVNYTDSKRKYTRIIEHKHFEFGTQPKTVITKEYPNDWTTYDEPYYPINDKKNNSIYQKYKKLAATEKKYIFGGRLGMYEYFNMDQVVMESLKAVKSISEKNRRG